MAITNTMYYLGILLSTPVIVSLSERSWGLVQAVLSVVAVGAIALLLVDFRSLNRSIAGKV